MKTSLKVIFFSLPLFSSASFACAPDIDIRNKLKPDIQSRFCNSSIKHPNPDSTDIFNSERYCLNDASEAVTSLGLPKQQVLRKMSMDYSEKYNELSFEDKIGFADIFLQRASRMFVSNWKEENGRISIYFDVLNPKGEVTQEAVKLFGDQPFSGEFQVAFLSHTEKYDKHFQQHSLEVLKEMYDVLYVKSCEVDNV